VLPNREKILKNEAVRHISGLPIHILHHFDDKNHFNGRNLTLADEYGIAVKNAMLINGVCMHASIQSLIIVMFKKAI